MSLLWRLAGSASNVLPFESVLRAKVQLAKIGAVRRLAFSRDLELLDRFLVDLGVRDPADIESAHRERCLATWTNRTRRRFMELPASRQAVWLKLAPGIEAALRPGALLVGSHFGCGFLTPFVLARLGIEIVPIVYTPTGARLLTRVLDLSRESRLRVAAEALSILRRGGVVFVAGDVIRGGPDNRVEVQMLGSRYQVSRGFAELSITASVPPTPVFSRIDQTGNVFTWVEAPLATTTGGRDRRTQVAEVAQAYADRLSTIFARFPGNVWPKEIERHFALCNE